MDTKISEVKLIATHLLAGMLANPHIYAAVSDEESRGQQEQKLLMIAIEMAESLIEKVNQESDSKDTSRERIKKERIPLD